MNENKKIRMIFFFGGGGGDEREFIETYSWGVIKKYLTTDWI